MFALAIKDLPVDTLYAKAAELQNNISHLNSSNEQLQPFADQGDHVCKEAISENDVVIKRMEERVGLCKVEVENRGLLWTGHADKQEQGDVKTNGVVNGEVNGDMSHEEDSGTGTTRALSGRLTDEDLRRQLEAQMGDDDEDGVHL